MDDDRTANTKENGQATFLAGTPATHRQQLQEQEMITVGTLAQDLHSGDDILLKDGKRYAIQMHVKSGQFVILKVIRQGKTDNIWFYLSSVVNKIIEK